ncbi:uncharacterized protein LOC119991445 [Tripterygium wilfordii]|uniref:uncharacterized protein LOC119991445 n=1 Tax=Tripterygium wilfordii TaxID=458696 RepID=UPI0018F84639|nr:uncharacterized protein LOC119991445 [Tripterygium wilfordii]
MFVPSQEGQLCSVCEVAVLIGVDASGHKHQRLESLFVQDHEEIDLLCWEFISLADAGSDSDLDDFVSWECQYDVYSPRQLSNNENQDSDHHNRSDIDEKLDGDEEDEELDDYDEDDELVPEQVSGKLGRQRMRKIGKRVFARITSSKLSPHGYVKPGCVYGKHGLGLKHSC